MPLQFFSESPQSHYECGYSRIGQNSLVNVSVEKIHIFQIRRGHFHLPEYAGKYSAPALRRQRSRVRIATGAPIISLSTSMVYRIRLRELARCLSMAWQQNGNRTRSAPITQPCVPGKVGAIAFSALTNSARIGSTAIGAASRPGNNPALRRRSRSAAGYRRWRCSRPA